MKETSEWIGKKEVCCGAVITLVDFILVLS